MTTTTLVRTITCLKTGAKPRGRHLGEEVLTLHECLRKRGWLHGWSMAVRTWPIPLLTEVACEAYRITAAQPRSS